MQAERRTKNNHGSVENLVRANTPDNHPRQRRNGEHKSGRRVRKEDIPGIHPVMVSTGRGRKMARATKGESEDLKDRKSYLVKIKEMALGFRKCELYPMISGYQVIKSWSVRKLIFTIHGNPGCEIWFRRFADLSKNRADLGTERGRKTTESNKERRRLSHAR